MKKKILVPVVATLMLLSCMVGGTLAYLVDTTEKVENTFTVGNVDITLDESEDLDLKMVPGKELTKDPTVTVEADSEDCWLFVKVEESENLDEFISWAVNDGWTVLEGKNGVYYREVKASDEDQEFTVLKDNTVTVLGTVTKEDLDELTGETLPTLTFTAYAVQKDGFDTAAAAWAEAIK